MARPDPGITARFGTLSARLHESRHRLEESPGLRRPLERLQRYQSRRMADTYSDLSRRPRYRQAIRFFLSDLYGPRVGEVRDAQLLRALSKLRRLLPAAALQVLADALELHALTLELDLGTATVLAAGPIDEAAYATAIRRAGCQADRERQLSLVLAIGGQLDRLSRQKSIRLLIALAHAPAHAAGYGALQDFIERGHRAFVAMQGGEEFLALIAQRERALLQRWLSGIPIQSNG